VIRYRSFRNSDPPALAALWNQVVPEQSGVRPLRVHELDDHAFGSVYFDRHGLTVAELEGRIVGFVHSGFGPDLPVESTRPFALGHSMGTIAILAVEPGLGDSQVPRDLILEAERYLRSRGASVLYAGGQFPLNPFYWGLYGGSEGSGVAAYHLNFPEVLAEMGYEPVSTTVSLEFDLRRPEQRDPRAVLIRRQTELLFEEDAMPAQWWENLALSDFRLTGVRIKGRSDGTEVARASIWDMSWFGRRDGRSRLGLFGVEVANAHRRKGYGRYLVCEISKWARERAISIVEVQAAATNRPALEFYESLDFQPVDHSTVYRLPAHLLERSLRP
jgi:ribosomal protein S18 acetylase RimI-like enzyme